MPNVAEAVTTKPSRSATTTSFCRILCLRIKMWVNQLDILHIFLEAVSLQLQTTLAVTQEHNESWWYCRISRAIKALILMSF